MSTQVQFRRGTTTQNNAFTGANGEISIDTDVKTIRLHDGVTGGGAAIMLNTTTSQTALNKTFSTGSVWTGNAVALAYGGTGSSLSAVSGAVAYSGASGLGLSAAGTSGQVLVSGGTNSPVWVNASSLTTGVATTAVTATNIAGGSAGQLIIQSDTGLSTFITAGASGTFLQSAGAGYAPTWAAGQVTIGSTAVALGATVTSFTGLNILTATGTSHWLLPVGTNAQRPGSPATGMVRYNTDTVSFEGYSSGAWSSLGGVSSVDKFTYIRAETSAGASNGELEFFAEDAAGTAAVKVAGMNRTRLLEATGTVLGTQTTQNLFNTVATTLNIGGAATTLSLGASTGNTTVNNNLVVTGNLTINGTTTTINATSLSIDDNIIRLAEGNAANIVDLGFVGNYTSGSALHTGLVKQASSSKWLLISGIAEPTNTVSLTGVVYDWLKLGTVEVTTGVAVNGSTSGTTTLVATAVAGTTTLTLPAATDTLVGKATTDTLTNKSLTSPVVTGTQNNNSLVYETTFNVGSITTATAVHSFATATYRSASYVFQITNGTFYKIVKVLVVHDGTSAVQSDAYIDDVEIGTGTQNTTYAFDISGGNVRLLVTAASGTATVKGMVSMIVV
jgi:hypothetical protein